MAKKINKTQAKKKTAGKTATKVAASARSAAKPVKSKSKAKPAKAAAKKITAKKIVAKKATKSVKTTKAASKKPTLKKRAPKKVAVKIVKKAVTKKPLTKRKAVAKKIKTVVVKKAVAKKAAPVKKLEPQDKKEEQQFRVKTSTNNPMEKMMTQGTTQFDKFSQGANGFGRENAEAFMKSGTIFAKGFEDLFRTGMTLAQDAAEKQAQFVKEAMAVKNINEFTDIQNKIAKTSFDDFMSNATKISELGTKLMTEASEPINTQVKKAKKATA